MGSPNWRSALLCVAFVACAPPSDDSVGDGSGEPAEDERPIVEAVTLDTTSFDEFIELVGETSAIRAASVTPATPGRILSLDLTEGEPVEEGTTVLRVDASVDAAQVDQLRAQLRAIETDIERAERLVSRGIGTRAELETLEAQRDVLEQSVRQVRTGIGLSTTRAPISGIVVDTYAEPGEYASPGQPVARILDLDTIVVEVGLPERDIVHVHEGMDVDVHVLATDQWRRGTLERIGEEANRSNRRFPLEVHVDNTDSDLRAGMRARVVIPRASYDGVVVVPRDAVLQGLDGEEVFVVATDDEAGTVAERRRLHTRADRAGYVLVHDGVSAGEQLIVRGHRGVVNAEPIRVIDSGACCDERFTRQVAGTSDSRDGDAPMPPETGGAE